jgi:hypothetical protein
MSAGINQWPGIEVYNHGFSILKSYKNLYGLIYIIILQGFRDDKRLFGLLYPKSGYQIV